MQDSKIDLRSLDNLIASAVKKVNARKDNDICRYLPGDNGGYIHHFTMRKMRSTAPGELRELISKFIINVDSPVNVPPKQRAARGSRKRPDQVVFSKQDLERMRNLARLTGDKYMERKLTPKRDLRALKRELLSSIRREEVDQDLWHSYVEIVSAQKQPPVVGDAAASQGQSN